MSQTDLIILTVYLICVFYVIRQAWDNLEEQTMIKNVENKFDPDSLKDIIKIEFKFKDDVRIKFPDQPKQLETTIANQSRTAVITIDWDRGSLTNFDGGDRKLVKVTDTLQKSDLAKQSTDTILPKGKRDFKLTAEGLLEEDAETKVMQPKKPIVDIEKLAQDKNAKPKPGDKKDEARIQNLKNIYGNFIDMRDPLRFSLRLPLQVTNYIDGSKKDIWGFVDCDFTISRTPRIEYVPWNPKPKKN